MIDLVKILNGLYEELGLFVEKCQQAVWLPTTNVHIERGFLAYSRMLLTAQRSGQIFVLIASRHSRICCTLDTECEIYINVACVLNYITNLINRGTESKNKVSDIFTKHDLVHVEAAIMDISLQKKDTLWVLFGAVI